MNSVRIVADSGCDIPAALAARYEISIVPCIVRFGRDAMSDADLTTETFWAKAQAEPQPPGTSAPGPSVYQAIYQRLVDAGHDVLCLTLPGNYSGSYNTAWLAAQEFASHVRVLDSRSISIGMGLQVLAAARQGLAGLSLDLVYRQIENLRDRTSVIFLLDTLEWVRRGGRIDRLLPLIDRVARTFHVKPVMELFNGEIRLLGVARSHRSALQRIEDEARARLPLELVCTAYTTGRQPAVELFEHLARLTGLPGGELDVVEAGPVFAAHAGPNALGTAVVRAA